MRVLFTIQYLGTRYCGWQLQPNGLSIQKVIEESLAKTYGAAIRLHSAGRTDAGVHAAAQRAHADVPFDIPARGLILGMNNTLPHDIRITAVEQVTDAFHARFDAKGKTYRYAIWNGEVDDVFAHETHAHVPQKLDVALMRGAASALIGQHDFLAFTVADPEVSETVRTIHRFDVDHEGRRIVLTTAADGFLRYQVRRMAGLLIEIGRGKLAPSFVREALDRPAYTRSWTAPAKGLTLLNVEY